jgi:hypothetical protein
MTPLQSAQSANPSHPQIHPGPSITANTRMRRLSVLAATALALCCCGPALAFVTPRPSSLGRRHHSQQQQQRWQGPRTATVPSTYTSSSSSSSSSSSTRRAAALDPEAVSTAVTVAASGAAAASPFVTKVRGIDRHCTHTCTHVDSPSGQLRPPRQIVNNLSSVAVLAVIIAVHELGHFLAGA